MKRLAIFVVGVLCICLLVHAQYPGGQGPYPNPNNTNAILATIYATNIASGGTLPLAIQGNGASFTNLTYQYTTNPIVGPLVLVMGQAMFTNISANVTATITVNNNAMMQTCALWVTNSSGSDFKITFPAGVWGTPGVGAPPVYFCTNKMLTRIMVETFGNYMTNAYKLDFAP